MNSGSPTRRLWISLAASAVILLAVPGFYFYTNGRAPLDQEAIGVLHGYLRATYARDFHEAYRFISSKDRRLKDETSYVRERGAFSGFALEIAKRLAAAVEIAPMDLEIGSHRAGFKAKLKVPDAGKLSDIVMDWDFEQLNSLPASRQKEIIDTIENLKKDGKLAMVEGEEVFRLVKEPAGWKVFLDWASGVKVTFNASHPSRAPVEAKIAQTEVIIKPGEPFNVSLQVGNRGREKISTRIGHRVQPSDAAGYLDLIECGFLLPVTIKAGSSEEFSSTYLLRGDLPENVRQLAVIYEFKVDK